MKTQQINARGGVLATFPGDDGEGREIRDQEHVGLGDAGEPGDRRAVDPLAAVDDVLENLHGNRDALDETHDVGELEVDELDLVFLRPAENFFLARAFAQDLLLQL